MRRKSSGGIPARENTVCTGSLRNCRKAVMDGTAGRGCCRLVVGRTPSLALGLVLGAQSPGTSGSSEFVHWRAVARFSEELALERSVLDPGSRIPREVRGEVVFRPHRVG